MCARACLRQVNLLSENLAAAKARAEDFNAREKVFGFARTEYAVLDAVEKELSPYFKLWNMLSDFESSKTAWLDGPFLSLEFAPIDAAVGDWWRTSYKLGKELEEESPGAAGVARSLRERTSQFKEYLPIIQSLASKALRDRHWEALGARLGSALEPDEELTLQGLLDMNVATHIESIQEVRLAHAARR